MTLKVTHNSWTFGTSRSVPTIVRLRPVQAIRGTVQHYAWGDPEFIPHFLGAAPDGRPWAELWLGTHQNGPSRLVGGPALADLTGPLPFLLKVLAAAEPLSLQAHPSADQAARRIRGRPLSGPGPETRAALRAHRVRGVLRRASARCDAHPPGRCRRGRVGRGGARRRSRWRARRAVSRWHPRRADRRRVPGERTARGPVGHPARRPLSRRPECRRHAAAQPGPRCSPGRRSSSAPAPCTPISAAPASS